MKNKKVVCLADKKNEKKNKNLRGFHVHLNVRGVLQNWQDHQFVGLMKDSQGRDLPVRDIKRILIDELLQGHEMLPFGDCDNFDYRAGCRGHPQSSSKKR